MPSGPRIRANNVYGLISDNPLAIGATTFNSSGLSVLPDVTAAHAVVVLDPKRVFGEPEIVVVTAHTALTTFATITRGQYGTVARSHPMNTSWAHVPIDEDFIEICTSVTHPSNPYVGQMIFETDLLTYKSWNGVSWVDVGSGAAIYQNASPPPGPAAGTLWLDTDEGAATGLSSIIAYTESTSLNQTGITAQTPVTGLTVTVTVPAGRRLRITGKIHINNSSAPGDRHLLQIVEGVTQLNGGYGSIENSGLGEDFLVQTIVSPSAGSHTYFLTLGRANGDGTLTAFGDATLPAYIMVEDITGTLWPAGQSIGAGAIASEAWTSFVPTVTQGVAVTVTVHVAKYIKIGRLVRFYMDLAPTSNGTAGQQVLISSLPFSKAPSAFNFDHVGSGIINDGSATDDITGLVRFVGNTTTLQMLSTRANGPLGSTTFTAALTTGDRIIIEGAYEAAS